MKTTNGIILDGNKLSAREISNAGFHNSIYREKDIYSYFADGTLWERISSGTFDDLFVGDYFEADFGRTHIMRIAGFDTFYNTFKTYSGENGMNSHHVIIIPDDCLEMCQMGQPPIVEGYVGTEMFKIFLPFWAGRLEEFIGSDHVLNVCEYLTSRVDDIATNCLRPDLTGASNECTWAEAKANLLSETEVFGYTSYSSSGYENGMGCYGQLPLFRLNPSKIIADETDLFGYWLRNVACDNHFCAVHFQGIPIYAEVGDYSIGVRPRFIIG